MTETLIASAIEQKRLLAFTYDDKPRLVEPHALGTTVKGDVVLRAFQVSGDSATNTHAWKLFTVAKITDLDASEVTFAGPRPGYRQGDRAMVAIVAELPEHAEA